MSDIKSVPKPAKIFQVSCNEEVKASVEAEVARTGETVAGYFKRLHHENIGMQKRAAEDLAAERAAQNS